jgi:predicted acylesterase/phospholipase RssA
VLSTGAAADDRAFLDWLGDRLKEAGFQDVDVTLADFHARSAGKGIQLSLVATDVTAKRSLVLNHKTAPGVPVRWAVRMSMGIPLVWAEVEWREEWGQYRGSSMSDEQGGHRVVDGGVLSNFPLKYLLEEKHATGDGALGPFREEVRASKLGLLLDETLPVPGTEVRVEKRRFAEKVAAYQSLSRLVDTMIGAWDQDILDDPKVKPIVCRIPVKGYDTLEFDMDPARMEPLVKSGRDAFKAFMKVPK